MSNFNKSGNKKDKLAKGGIVINERGWQYIINDTPHKFSNSDKLAKIKNRNKRKH